jgi:hypothetical protein
MLKILLFVNIFALNSALLIDAASMLNPFENPFENVILATRDKQGYMQELYSELAGMFNQEIASSKPNQFGIYKRN